MGVFHGANLDAIFLAKGRGQKGLAGGFLEQGVQKANNTGAFSAS
jgi:hypothetical protein